MLPRITTIDPTLRYFQYKILNNILYLNERLYKIKVVESPLCSLCEKQNESVIHLFCTCILTQSLWQQLTLWLQESITLPILDPEIVIFGLWNSQSTDYILINHIILLFKRFLYLKRTEKHNVSISGLKGFVKSIENIERQIASGRQKLDIHYKKWNSVLSIL